MLQSELTSAGFNDIFILKLDTAGHFVWAKALGGKENDFCNSIATDAFGAIYLTGFCDKKPDFDGTFISKLDSLGNFTWTKKTEVQFSAFKSAIKLNRSNDILIAGTCCCGCDGGYVAKMDAKGTIIWSKRLELGINHLAIDANDGIYLTGEYSGKKSFKTGNKSDSINSAGMSDIFLLKLDTKGDLAWIKEYGEKLNDAGKSVACDKPGNIYVSGEYDADETLHNQKIFILKIKQ
ncbi:MAG: hypothetical protein ACHQK8_01620 [Bacteroidia bacterium]